MVFFFSNCKSNSCSSILIKIFDLVLKEGQFIQIGNTQGLEAFRKAVWPQRCTVVRAEPEPWPTEMRDGYESYCGGYVIKLDNSFIVGE